MGHNGSSQGKAASISYPFLTYALGKVAINATDPFAPCMFEVFSDPCFVERFEIASVDFLWELSFSFQINTLFSVGSKVGVFRAPMDGINGW